MFLDRVAAHAAIAEAVELAKPSPGHRVVNAVLRRVQREGVELPADDTPAGAAIRHSHPEWLVRLWWDLLGADEARALLAADNEPAELALRVNPLVALRPRGHPGPSASGDTIVVDGAVRRPRPTGLRRGRVHAAVARLAARRAAARPAAGRARARPVRRAGRQDDPPRGAHGRPGRDRRRRAPPAAAPARCGHGRRMRASNVRVVVGDARAFDDDDGFDRVLLDPPCSGPGDAALAPRPALARDAAGASRVLAAEQDALLAARARALRARRAPRLLRLHHLPAEERLAAPAGRDHGRSRTRTAPTASILPP